MAGAFTVVQTGRRYEGLQTEPGMADLLQVRRFFAEIVPFDRLRPAPDLIVAREWASGRRPLALSTAERDVVAVYLPVGESVDLARTDVGEQVCRWFDPRTGELGAAVSEKSTAGWRFDAPADGSERPLDWVLVILAKEGR